MVSHHPGYNPKRHLSGKTHWCWVASYHGKYSTKTRSHILICDCFLKDFFNTITQTQIIKREFVQQAGYVPMCRIQ